MLCTARRSNLVELRLHNNELSSVPSTMRHMQAFCLHPTLEFISVYDLSSANCWTHRY